MVGLKAFMGFSITIHQGQRPEVQEWLQLRSTDIPRRINFLFRLCLIDPLEYQPHLENNRKQLGYSTEQNAEANLITSSKVTLDKWSTLYTEQLTNRQHPQRPWTKFLPGSRGRPAPYCMVDVHRPYSSEHDSRYFNIPTFEEIVDLTWIPHYLKHVWLDMCCSEAKFA